MLRVAALVMLLGALLLTGCAAVPEKPAPASSGASPVETTRAVDPPFPKAALTGDWYAVNRYPATGAFGVSRQHLRLEGTLEKLHVSETVERVSDGSRIDSSRVNADFSLAADGTLPDAAAGIASEGVTMRVRYYDGKLLVLQFRYKNRIPSVWEDIYARDYAGAEAFAKAAPTKAATYDEWVASRALDPSKNQVKASGGQ